MFTHNWIEEIDATIIVCDKSGIILFMNNKADKSYAKDGGRKALIGKSLIDCHPEPAKSKLQSLLSTQDSNTYTIGKNGIKKIIIQKPWYNNSEYMGFVEMVYEIPFEMPHFIRKPNN